MEAHRKPDPRWENFIEQLDSKGLAIGFKLEDNDFLFEYDDQGGWSDEKGRLFDANGVLIDDEQEQQNDDDQSDVDDDEIVDEFQKMLMEEEEGIIRTKSKQQEKKASQPKTGSGQINYDEEFKKYIEKLLKKEELREGLNPQVWIFFKMRSNLYQRVKYEAEKTQNTIQKNDLIKQIKKNIQTRRQTLINQNQKWLNGNFFLDYSGNSLEEGVYDRYWYGYVKIAPENFFTTLEEIKKSKEFSILRSKTFDALKSKFFLKNKMKETIADLKVSLNKVALDEAVLVKINNLPQEFRLSFVLDLVQITGGHLEDIQDIDIVDNFSADMIVKKRTAETFTNVEGYPHDQKEYIWLEFQPQNRPAKFNKFFNVEVDSEFKPLFRETADVLALESSSDEIAKFYDANEQFRIVVNQNVINKILMFRGESLNVARIVRFEKKE